MTSTISLQRYDRELDGEALWEAYRDPNSIEFFRRSSPSMTKDEVLNFEQNHACQLFSVLEGECLAGFIVVSCVCPYSLSCQVGITLFKEYQDKKVEGGKLAFVAMWKLCELLFERTTMRKISMRILANRQDLNSMLERNGYKKEGTFEASAFCYGDFQDEAEFAFTKNAYLEMKAKLV